MSVSGEEVKIAPYGSWKSPLSSKVVSGSSISFQDLKVDPKNPGRNLRSVTLGATHLRFPGLPSLMTLQ